MEKRVQVDPALLAKRKTTARLAMANRRVLEALLEKGVDSTNARQSYEAAYIAMCELDDDIEREIVRPNAGGTYASWSFDGDGVVIVIENPVGFAAGEA